MTNRWHVAATSAVVAVAVAVSFAAGLALGRDRSAADDEREEPPPADTALAEGQDGCGPGAQEPMVCIRGATVTDRGLVVQLRYAGFVPSIESGMHAHIYPGSTPTHSVSSDSPEPGTWEIADSEVFLVAAESPVLVEILRSGVVCAATAEPSHVLTHHRTSCLEVPR